MARRHKKRSHGEVELNLAAMLDMAFQLLTFFILTFRPAPIEGQLSLHLPPPLPITQVEVQQKSASTGDGNSVAPVKSLVITIHSDPDGKLSRIKVGFRSAIVGSTVEDTLRNLAFQLDAVFSIEGTPFEQVVLQIGSGLKYEDLMRVVEVCTRQKLPDGTRLSKISFTELPEDGG